MGARKNELITTQSPPFEQRRSGGVYTYILYILLAKSSPYVVLLLKHKTCYLA